MMKTKEELGKEILAAHWVDMQFHLEKGNVLSVSPTLGLAEVGEVLATDRVSQVQTWIQKGFIVRLEQANLFDKEDLFSILIIQPFILVQRLEKEE